MVRKISYAVGSVTLLIWVCQVSAEILIADDFEYFPANSGVHSVSPPGGTGKPLNTVWDQVVYWHKLDAIQIICDGTAATGNCYLTEHFLPGHLAASELRDNADQLPTVWTPPSEEVWIRHFVRWPKGWEWPHDFGGIKLGRLRIADSCRPDGPCIETVWGPMHGNASRIHWAYGYTLNGSDWCCVNNQVSGPWPGGFQTNRWYCIELHLKQNTKVTPPNGLMEIYVDGQLVGSNYAVDTRGNSGPGTFAWTVFNITDNFVGTVGGTAAATERTPALHFDGVVFSTTRDTCPLVISPHQSKNHKKPS